MSDLDSLKASMRLSSKPTNLDTTRFHARPIRVNPRKNHENPAEHQYVVSLDDVTNELIACTCPHHVHYNTFCKHVAAVETATENGTLNAFPLEDNEDDVEPDDCDCNEFCGFPTESAYKRITKHCRTDSHSLSIIFCQHTHTHTHTIGLTSKRSR